MQPPAVVTRYPIADTACSSRWTRLSRCDSRSLQASRSISQCSLCYLIHSRGKGRHSPWGTSTVTASRTSTWGARMGFPESCSCNVPAAALWNQSRGSRGQPTAPTRTGERHSSMPMATACDLYVASGSYRLAPRSPRLQDRLYINRGGGRFVRDSAALPAMLTSTASIAAGDFNGDGKVDLFVGGRL